VVTRVLEFGMQGHRSVQLILLQKVKALNENTVVL
jgi:hypothetical protein